MRWWVAVAVAVVGLIILVAAVMPLLPRLARLRAAVQGLAARQEQAAAIQMSAERLAVRLADVQRHPALARRLDGVPSPADQPPAGGVPTR
ncbi:hypothetical protein [Pilimelia columellifera]|uniref:Uncharacterized protein n=1 Tax=Pilimelia columellifera subsp. columellifera TaxID=706583 RepID=A0ABN3NKY9_9ACTN